MEGFDNDIERPSYMVMGKVDIGKEKLLILLVNASDHQPGVVGSIPLIAKSSIIAKAAFPVYNDDSIRSISNTVRLLVTRGCLFLCK